MENIESAPIVDDALNYDCPKTLNTYLLTVNNVLHIPSMQRNTVPPFFIRETGLEVNAVPRIHIRDEVKRESQSIMLPQVDLKIPLRISGVFYCFEEPSLTDKDIEECETMNMVFVNTDSKVWDLHCDSYSEQEDNFVNFRRELKYPPEPKRQNIIYERDYINYSIHNVDYEASIDAVISANDCVSM